MAKFNIISERDEFIMRAIMRHAWPMWTGRKEALARAAYYTTEGHRRRRYWRCDICGKEKLCEGDRQVDHRSPRTPVSGFDDILSWLERTLCDADGLDVLCLECHKEKSAKEAGERAEARKAKKSKAKRKQGRRG